MLKQADILSETSNQCVNAARRNSDLTLFAHDGVKNDVHRPPYTATPLRPRRKPPFEFRRERICGSSRDGNDKMEFCPFPLRSSLIIGIRKECVSSGSTDVACKAQEMRGFADCVSDPQLRCVPFADKPEN
jgi:hypothetical protein